jgi:hypothetical protein
MKNVSTGAGLCVLGLCIVGYPLVDRISTRAEAGIPATGAVAAAALAQDPPAPTVVWMGVSMPDNFRMAYHRLWSDGRMEMRAVDLDFQSTGAACETLMRPTANPQCTTEWVEVPAPPGGNGFACRTDLNGDRAVDGVDLGMLLGDWGRFTPCNPEPEYPCVKFGGGWIEPPGQ